MCWHFITTIFFYYLSFKLYKFSGELIVGPEITVCGRDSKIREEFTVFSPRAKLIGHLRSLSEMLNKDQV